LTSRPWLRLYPDWVPAQLDLPVSSALAFFTAAARGRPDAPAIHYFEETTTFAELDRDSSAFAAALADRGVVRGDRVAVFLQNVSEFPLAMIAAWKLGAAVVPLNPMLKAQEVAYQLADSGARAIVALDSLEPVVSAARAEYAIETVITTTELGELLDRFRGEEVPDPGLGADEVAFLTYTSGTTGRPKGAMNTHGNVAFNSESYRTWLRLDGDDVVLGMAPLFHITGLIGHLTLAMLAGIPVVLFHRFDAGEALRLAERWGATFTIASITAFLALMDHPDAAHRDLSRLRKVCSGGAPVAPATVERWQRLTGSYIHNFYGLTETTSPSHAVPLGARAPVDPDSSALSVGLPLPSTEVKIVDLETLEELPPGGVGELWTRGPQVVPGYWRRPDATAETFTDGFLHTGDVGKMDADGWFYIVDRAKDMINASGFKVWPREVEDALYQHPAVREAAVVGVPDAYRGETVRAFVSLKTGMTADPEQIIRFCRERMAVYKAPRQVEIVPEVPKNASGKFLRRVLRERGQSNETATRER
jgi:long-chain acyl-CoA synthetase